MLARTRSGLISLLCLLTLAAAAQDAPFVLPLWPNGAPGFENRRNEPERAESCWVKNIHNPSVPVFLPPKEKATGAAVVICPGGGHAFNMGNRSKLATLKGWPQRLADWLADNNILNPALPAPNAK